jgi:hypothetical protein
MSLLKINPDNPFDIIEMYIINNMEYLYTPNAGHIPIDKRKGLFLWFLNIEAYSSLNESIVIIPIQPSISIHQGNSQFDLVYIDATDSKTAKKNVTEMLHFHTYQPLTENLIKSKNTSPLKMAIASILFDDLLDEDVNEDTNLWMHFNMKVYWIPYEDLKVLKKDHVRLIEQVRPIFNIEHNPNAKPGIVPNSTRNIRRRMEDVWANSKI